MQWQVCEELCESGSLDPGDDWAFGRPSTIQNLSPPALARSFSENPVRNHTG
jgi:hypothetical protein